MSGVARTASDSLTILPSGGGVMRRNANTRRWYRDGLGSLTDGQVDMLVKRQVLRFADHHCDQLELVDDPARQR